MVRFGRYWLLLRRLRREEMQLFWGLVGALFAAGLVPFFFFDSPAFFVFVKQWHHPIADRMAPCISALGSGWTYLGVLCVVASSRVRCKHAWILGGSFLCMTLVVQALKRLFFVHALRPSACMAMEAIHCVQGVKLLQCHSFPSGHAGTIFTLATAFQLILDQRRRWYACVLLMLAVPVAYSRIYLCQHFYRDVYVGAGIGVASAALVHRTVARYLPPAWLDQSVCTCIRNLWKRVVGGLPPV